MDAERHSRNGTETVPYRNFRTVLSDTLSQFESALPGKPAVAHKTLCFKSFISGPPQFSPCRDGVTSAIGSESEFVQQFVQDACAGVSFGQP